MEREEHTLSVGRFSDERILRGIPEQWDTREPPGNHHTGESLMEGILRIEARYEAENRLMEAVARGQTEKVQMLLSDFGQDVVESRTDPVRDARNYLVILNTLMRKAAEQGGVHPIYIDRISSSFARAIEQTLDWEDFLKLWKEMALRYCLMVQKHNLSGYSPLVQKVITRVDFDLLADLSLRTVAKGLNVSASYLSAVFKQETGRNYIDYVNQKRMDQAQFLLIHSRQPISTIAQACGIQDDNYFTKLFKKYKEMTPNQFRRVQRNLGQSGGI